MEVNFNLFDLIKRLERHKGKPVTQTHIAEQAGLSRYTVQKIVGNETNRVDLSTLAKLLDFFHREGLDVGIADLFVVTESETK